MSINFISSNSDKTRNMHKKSDNIEIMIGSETDEIIEELFKSLLQGYQEGSEKPMKGSESIFDGVNLLYYHLQKASLKRTGSSYIDYSKWLKNKKATLNPKSNDTNCFQYATVATLNHKQIKNHPERISNLNPFINQYVGKEYIFHENKKKTGKEFNQMTSQLLLTFYFCHLILKK